MTEREALKLALEALEKYPVTVNHWKTVLLPAAAAIREVLALPEQHQDWCASLTQMLASMPPKQAPCNCKPAQPEQEPVAWFRYETVYEYKNQLARCTKDCIGAFPVYTFPPKRESEPVIDKSAAVRIATSLGWEPKRKPLTSKQIREWWASENGFEDCDMTKLDDFTQVVRGVEGKHGIKE